jgi:hypothetical protein
LGAGQAHLETVRGVGYRFTDEPVEHAEGEGVP